MTGKLMATVAALALGLGAGGLLGGCGSSTKTVSVAGAPPPSTTASTAGTPTSAARTQTAGTPAPTSTAGGTSAPNTTRSAPEPAFTEEQPAAGDSLAAAAATVRARGYSLDGTTEYHPNQTLRVLVGTRPAATNGFGQQAFFFVGGRYIGTDTKEPSAAVRVVSQSDTEVVLAYPLYRSSDPSGSPSGGTATVHFQLNNGRLTALQPVPPVSSSNGLSRR